MPPEAGSTQYLAINLETLSAMASIWIERGNGEQALTLYKKAASEDPGSVMIHQQIMRLYTELGRRGEVVGHFQDVIGSIKDKDSSVVQQLQSFYDEMMA